MADSFLKQTNAKEFGQRQVIFLKLRSNAFLKCLIIRYKFTLFIVQGSNGTAAPSWLKAWPRSRYQEITGLTYDIYALKFSGGWELGTKSFDCSPRTKCRRAVGSEKPQQIA